MSAGLAFISLPRLQRVRLTRGSLLAFGALGLLPSCSSTPQPAAQTPVQTPMAQYANGRTGAYGYDGHVPDFASRNFVPFNRQDVVAIAMREWRMFGSPVSDDDPEDRPEPSAPSLKPERIPGLWQRVGEYWWIGQDPYETEVSWSGKYNADGQLSVRKRRALCMVCGFHFLCNARCRGK